MNNLFEKLVQSLPKGVGYSLTYRPVEIGSYIKEHYEFQLGKTETTAPPDALDSDDYMIVSEWFTSGGATTPEGAFLDAVTNHIKSLPDGDLMGQLEALKSQNEQLTKDLKDARLKRDAIHHEHYNERSRLNNELVAKTEEADALAKQVANLLKRNHRLASKGDLSVVQPKKRKNKRNA